MAVKEKLRWEIFRRDNFACRYCGITVERGAVLQVDHVVPRSRGGKDVPQNLLTACRDCNSGKSDTPLDAPVVDDVPQADFRHLCRLRDAPPPRDSDDFEDFEIEAAVAWSHGWSPGFVDFGGYHVSFELAVAAGRGRQEILIACELGGQGHDSNLGAYMSHWGRGSDGPEESAAYDRAVECLHEFIPSERCEFIQRARIAAGSYQPNEAELIRAAATIARQYDEEGRDYERLRRWLSHLPDDAGAKLLADAEREWDDAFRDWPNASKDCTHEVLDLAVRRALGAGVSA